MVKNLKFHVIAMTGDTGNFKLELQGAEAMALSATLVLYQEQTSAGEIKRLRFRLESSGEPSLI
jgi:hypothetical protein